MLTGQKIGPFVIGKELGSGAMGTVYRAVYSPNGQSVAVKFMSPSLGSNERSLARFEREGAILKQLRHPNIVRLYGVGRHHGMPYYAMEYIEGESLDHSMGRRGRITWEEIVALGQPLCSALHYAHLQGIIHRDLKPSNIMVLPNGTVKLTDFGIAKDVDVTQITSANCTVGTASYMSPEQCRGERDLTFKSDLYSLGVMFYELLVGKKPFNAENAMDMFLLHVNGTFERPGRLVLDIPVWLDTLVCQLLEKRPDQRPRDAEMVSQVLGSITEKVAAQQSAGVDAARKRMIDRQLNAAKLDQSDKQTARLLLDAKFRVKRRKKVKPLYERKWFQAVSLSALLLAVIAMLVVGFWPPSAQTLYERAERLMQSSDPEKHAQALESTGPIALYFHRYPDDSDTRRMEQMRAWAEQTEAEQREDQLRSKINRANNLGSPFKAANESEGQAYQAIRFEDFGDKFSAYERWQTVWNQIGDKPPPEDEGGSLRRLGLLAKKKMRELGPKTDDEEALETLRKERLDFVQGKLEEAIKEKKESKILEIIDLYKNHKDPNVVKVIEKLDASRKTPEK